MKHASILIGLIALFAAAAFADEPPAKPKGPPPGGKGGPGPSQESAEMQKLLASFNLTEEQRAKYAAARAATAKAMRDVHEGKVSGSMKQDEVLRKALASHKAFNAAVKEILTAEQYAVWEPLREGDHHKIAQAHKQRDEAAAKAAAEKKPDPAK